jgi:hypothetical protein
MLPDLPVVEMRCSENLWNALLAISANARSIIDV